ncbi:MAG: 2-oxoglutarate ferredoxin oxidoreductase, delta subunit [bacterium]|nr:MAG: 2-oxoglutarate ferredoxin oxidoreductase, delta subunit [bacterium]
MNESPASRRKVQKFLGNVEILVERCKGCAFCVEFCPSSALELSSGFNSKGYHPPVLVSEDFCNGCGLCGLYCPDFAIFGYRVGPNPRYQKDQPKASPEPMRAGMEVQRP